LASLERLFLNTEAALFKFTGKVGYLGGKSSATLSSHLDMGITAENVTSVSTFLEQIPSSA
jgi:hypothetical protein